MHELSLSSAIVESAIRHAEGRRVTEVRVRVGALRQVVPDSLVFYFGIVSRDTLCEGARLETTVVPARLRCQGCAQEWEPRSPSFRCPACRGASVTVLSGEEFQIESILVEVSPSCITSQ